MRQAVILYDAECGFCKWTTAKVLAWDRAGRLRPVALQDPEAAALLKGLEHEERIASWHLVTTDGEVHSAGVAFAPLLRLLPAGALPAAAVARVPRTAERLYGLVAARRVALGRWVRRLAGSAAIERAERRIGDRAAATAPSARDRSSGARAPRSRSRP